MKRRTKYITAAAVVLAAAGGTGMGVAASGDSATPIAGDAYDRATAAALAATGGGRVTATEVGDEESYYQVEVTLDDGSQVDVQLDANFAVVGTKGEAADGGN